MEVYEILTLILATFQAMATILIAYVLFRQTEKLKKLEYAHNLQAAYNTLNVAAISSEENLLAFDSLGRADIKEDKSIRRKRWAGFVWLCTLQNVYLSFESSMLDKDYGKKTLEEQLNIILKDDLVWDILLNRGFHPKFIKYCEPIRAKVSQNAISETS